MSIELSFHPLRFTKISGTYYRYDGLYQIKSFQEGMVMSDDGKGEEFVYELV